jgi:hypothetical protein
MEEYLTNGNKSRPPSRAPTMTATIVAGTLAERCQMKSYLFYSMTMTGFGKIFYSSLIIT